MGRKAKTFMNAITPSNDKTKCGKIGKVLIGVVPLQRSHRLGKQTIQVWAPSQCTKLIEHMQECLELIQQHACLSDIMTAQPLKITGKVAVHESGHAEHFILAKAN